MEYNVIGKTGIKVSNLCMGTMSFGGEADIITSKAMYKACRQRGINFFDTANIYNNGKSEKILGECIADDNRNEIILSTKVYHSMNDNINATGLNRHNIINELENSLRRLKTDYIDFYFVHMFDNNTSIEKVMSVLDYLQKQGKILYPAVSNWAAWQIAISLGISEKKSLARFELVQPMYNLVKRQAEIEILPLANSQDLGVISYSPLGAGLLTGKYGINKKPVQGRLVESDLYYKRYHDKLNYEIAEKFNLYAESKNISPVTLAVAWVKSNPVITSPIIGARNLNQLKVSLAAAELEISEEMRQEISNISRTPSPATDRREELLNDYKS
jgi:aryl-alcohol dehydrogenase-like predicted oxidoreductase